MEACLLFPSALRSLCAALLAASMLQKVLKLSWCAQRRPQLLLVGNVTVDLVDGKRALVSMMWILLARCTAILASAPGVEPFNADEPLCCRRAALWHMQRLWPVRSASEHAS